MATSVGLPCVHTATCRLRASIKTRASAGTRHMPKSVVTNPSTAANRIAGEWDGVLVSFNSRGEAVELPHSVVPDAFREWGVTLVAWQTQCSMHCGPDGHLHYTLRRLFPTVGCEGAGHAQQPCGRHWFTHSGRRRI